MVEHDMGVVMDIADRIVVLDWGPSLPKVLQKRLR
jgi:ABC-type branched-subunit amino acid transport system ATPase component